MTKRIKLSALALSIVVLIAMSGYFSLPFFFESVIKIEIEGIIDDMFMGKASYESISVSSYADLPYLKITLGKVSVSDTLNNKPDSVFQCTKAAFSISLKDWLLDHRYVVKKINIDNPVVKALVLKDGTSNFLNIIKQDTSGQSDKDTAQFNFKINSFTLTNGSIFYVDKQQKNNFEAHNIQLSGGIDIRNDLRKIKINFETHDVLFKHKKILYLYRNTIAADINLNYNTSTNTISLEDHFFSIDYFKFGFAGYITSKPKELEINLKFKTQETQLKNIISLIPGVYKKEYEKFDMKGSFGLDGEIKGIYNKRKKLLPSFFVHFKLDSAEFKYKDLPQPITDLSLDLRFEKKSKDLEPIITLNKFHAKLDSNYLDAVVTIVGTKKPYITGKLNAILELHELNQYIKIDSIEIGGHMLANMTVDGFYDADSSRFPKMYGNVALNKGFLKRLNIPYAMENIELETNLRNSTGFVQNTALTLSKLNFNVGGEALQMYGKLEDFKKYNFNLFMKSDLDLEKLAKLFSVQNQTITGTTSTKMMAKGSLNDIKNVYINGTASFANVHWIDAEDDLDIKIKQGYAVFSPEQLILSRFDMKIHDFTFDVNGTFKNYYQYLTSSNEKLYANLRINADTLNLNRFISENSSSPKSQNDSTDAKIEDIEPKKSFEVFKNISIDLKFNAKHVKYKKYNASGLVLSCKADEKLIQLENVAFSTLESRVSISKSEISPKNFSLNLDIKSLDTKKLLKLISDTDPTTTKDTTKDESSAVVSINYKLKGTIDNNFKPKFELLEGNGTISVEKARIKGLKVAGHIGKAANQQDLHHQEIEETTIETEIKNAKVFIKPFIVKLGKYTTHFEGTHSFSNEIDYFVRLGVPPFNKIKIPMHITGTLDNPVVKINKKKEKS